MSSRSTDEVGSDSALARQLMAAVYPWARTKRWWPASETPSKSECAIWRLNSTTDESVILTVVTNESRLLVQIPLVLSSAVKDSEQLVAQADDLYIYDGTGQRVFWESWARAASVHPLPDQTDEDARAFLLEATKTVRPLGAEQSNTSVLLLGSNHPLIAKVFRVLHPGVHPEVQIPAALDGWSGLPRLWANLDVRLDDGEETTCLAVVTDAVEGAEDGFVTLRAMANANIDPQVVATEIGVLVAQLHKRLENSFGTGPGPSAEELRARLNHSLEVTVSNTNDLSSADIDALKTAIDALTVRADTETKAIRVHGDLHLGQLLRGSDGTWNVVDFEGEPLRPLDERRSPDSPARDLAGMLRSFDYAAQSDGKADPSWLKAARQAFLDGYQSVSALTPSDLANIKAYELDKALYELQYESQFRPNWTRIPKTAILRIASPYSGAGTSK